MEFLTTLGHDTAGPVVLIRGNHSAHQATPVRDYVDVLKGHLKLCYLPGYAPELNPDEGVWKNVKNDQVRRSAIIGKSESFDPVTRALKRLQQPPDVVRGSFRDPALAYNA